MAYEMKEDTFSFSFNENNINAKFPALTLKINSKGKVIELATWVRKNQYGLNLSGDLNKLIPFVLALFGEINQAQSIQPPVQPVQSNFEETQQPRKEESRKSLIR